MFQGRSNISRGRARTKNAARTAIGPKDRPGLMQDVALGEFRLAMASEIVVPGAKIETEMQEGNGRMMRSPHGIAERKRPRAQHDAADDADAVEGMTTLRRSFPGGADTP